MSTSPLPSLPLRPPPIGRWLREDARFDVPASLVVFLVAIPLSLGIAVASGAPVAAGLIAAAVGGIVAGLVGGSVLQVSGPAAGLTVIVAETVASYGWEVTCLITAGAGILQILLGATRVGRLALAISPTVVHGMLAGIGITIVLGQLNVAMGGQSQSSAWGNLTQYATSLASLDLQALVAAASVVAVMVAWPRLPSRVRAVPAALVAIAGVTVVAALVLPQAQRVDLGGSVLSQIGLPPMPDGQWLGIAGAVITVALIASVESLLSAVAVDKLAAQRADAPTPRPSNLDRELLGQGAANSLSGLLGGLPVTGVIVRSATNVASGGRTQMSAILHGAWVVVFSLLLVALVEQIPLAALAGLLIVMGVGLVKPRDIATAQQRGEGWIYGATIAGVLALNLVEGVLIGLTGAVLVLLFRILRVGISARRSGVDADGRDVWVVSVRGTVSFLSTPRLVRALDQVPPGQHVEIDLLVDYLDPATQETLDGWMQRYHAAGGVVEVQASGTMASASEVRSGKPDPVTLRTMLPWDHWQPVDGSARTPTERLAGGIREYHRRGPDVLEQVYDELRDGQSPDALVLSCVDSRVVLNLVTASGPGDLFTVRTMGNLVPDPAGADCSVSAPFDFAVDHLDVPLVAVLGHSGCGAMAAALGDRLHGPIGEWMAHADEAVDAWRSGHPIGRAAAAAGESEADQLSQVNVAVALDRLRAMAGERAGDLTFVGLWFRIDDGSMHLLCDGAFTPLVDAELSQLAPRGRLTGVSAAR
ncbi:solute carrier family 23 protein [Nocardioides acrostichi]|uniref:Bifunctional SulP family inorganic anion transporter/carbonic anhydrase n=1 Tax=Nocardioides acrostichi TaxID=2784339 RepID=A0A930UZN7_9ACTN|nr:bifunctional SulP family inorganic anion transporter/carbonic anhydrase [Nocardioides acrostichi]MBF4161191.1 bifunctional SulP family inorganic anion transporter/carbonic anhydrase [Nocardioides acrostichi]